MGTQAPGPTGAAEAQGGAVKSEILREKPLGQKRTWSRPGQGPRKISEGAVCVSVCVTHAHGHRHNVQGGFGECAAMPPTLWRSVGLSPWPPKAKGTHLGVESLGRKLGWKWFRPQNPHPAREAVKGPAVPVQSLELLE